MIGWLVNHIRGCGSGYSCAVRALVSLKRTAHPQNARYNRHRHAMIRSPMSDVTAHLLHPPERPSTSSPFEGERGTRFE